MVLRIHNTLSGTKEIFGEIKSQQITLWDVDMLERYTENILCGSLVFEGNLIEGNLEESPDLIRDAWFYANKNPTRDRLGPESLFANCPYLPYPHTHNDPSVFVQILESVAAAKEFHVVPGI